MKISRKITLTIVLTLLLLLGVGYVGLHYVVGNKFGELERMSVERNRERVRAVVQAELGQLTMLGQDWSEWDETYAYMVSRDPAYLAANLNVRTFETLGVDLVALYDADKQPQAAFAYHGGQQVAQTPAQLAPLTDYLVRYGSLKPNAGIWFDGERYYLLAATQILTSEGEGLSGTILMAPLKQGDELLGLIIAERARLSGVWHPDELAFVLSVCDLSAQTLLTLTKLQRLKRS